MLKVTLNGMVTAGIQEHVNVKPGHAITKENCREISNVKVSPAPVVSNGVILELTGGSEWTVSGTSYLSSLTIGEDCAVNGAMTVNGKTTEPVAGVYKGEIVVFVK